MIQRLRVDPARLPAVQFRPPGHMSGQSEGCRLCCRAPHKFCLLLTQRIPTHTVPEGGAALNAVWQIRHIGVRNAAAQALNADQSASWIAERTGHGKRVRKFRAEDMDYVRPVLLQNIREHFLQSRIVALGMAEIFPKPIENHAVHFLPDTSEESRDRTAHCKIDVPRLVAQGIPPRRLIQIRKIQMQVRRVVEGKMPCALPRRGRRRTENHMRYMLAAAALLRDFFRAGGRALPLPPRRHDTVEASGQPALPICAGKPVRLCEDRKHNVTKP